MVAAADGQSRGMAGIGGIGVAERSGGHGRHRFHALRRKPSIPRAARASAVVKRARQAHATM
jgi:hypothetical protein